MLENIRWHGAASFAIFNGLHVYINPRRVARPDRPADLILISSGHYDHCSLSDIDKLRGPGTQLVISQAAANVLEGNVVLRPWQSTASDGVCVKALPVYRPDGQPDESGEVGFVISTGLYDIYYTGRTASLPAGSAHPDILIVPISAASVMSAAETASAIRQMSPRWIIPYGWQSGGRTGQAEAQEFARLLDSSLQVVILEPNP